MRNWQRERKRQTHTDRDRERKRYVRIKKRECTLKQRLRATEI